MDEIELLFKKHDAQLKALIPDPLLDYLTPITTLPRQYSKATNNSTTTQQQQLVDKRKSLGTVVTNLFKVHKTSPTTPTPSDKESPANAQKRKGVEDALRLLQEKILNLLEAKEKASKTLINKYVGDVYAVTYRVQKISLLKPPVVQLKPQADELWNKILNEKATVEAQRDTENELYIPWRVFQSYFEDFVKNNIKEMNKLMNPFAFVASQRIYEPKDSHFTLLKLFLNSCSHEQLKEMKQSSSSEIYDRLYIYEIQAFTRQQDLLAAFATMLLDEEKEFAQTRVSINQLCLQMCRMALEHSCIQKFKHYTEFKAFVKSFELPTKHSPLDFVDELKRDFAQLLHKSETQEWKLEVPRREYEIKVRNTIKELEEEQKQLVASVPQARRKSANSLSLDQAAATTTPTKTGREYAVFVFEQEMNAQLRANECVAEEFLGIFTREEYNAQGTQSMLLLEPGVITITNQRFVFTSHHYDKKAASKQIQIPITQFLTLEHELAKKSSDAIAVPSVLRITRRDGKVLELHGIVNIDACYNLLHRYVSEAMQQIELNGEKEAIKEGILTKQGKIAKNWKKRHFVLYADRIIYKKNAGATKEQGSIPVNSIIGVEREQSSKTKYPNSFSLLTVDRRFRIQALTLGDLEDWVLAIQTTLRRQNLQYPYVYFGVYKRNNRNKFQWRILLLDFLNRCVKNLKGQVLKRHFLFQQLEKIEKDKENPLHIMLHFKNYKHVYELYFPTSVQSVLFESIVTQIVKKPTSVQISDFEQDMIIASTFTVEHAPKSVARKKSVFAPSNAMPVVTNTTTMLQQLAENAKKEAENPTMDSSSTPKSRQRSLSLLTADESKRWLLVQAGQLIVFAGTCDGYPLYMMTLINMNLSEDNLFLKLQAGQETAKVFEFASAQEAKEWSRIFHREETINEGKMTVQQWKKGEQQTNSSNNTQQFLSLSDELIEKESPRPSKMTPSTPPPTKANNDDDVDDIVVLRKRKSVASFIARRTATSPDEVVQKRRSLSQPSIPETQQEKVQKLLAAAKQPVQNGYESSDNDSPRTPIQNMPPQVINMVDDEDNDD